MIASLKLSKPFRRILVAKFYIKWYNIKMDENTQNKVRQAYLEVADKPYEIRAATLQSLSEETQLSVAKLRVFLNKEGIYVKKEYITKSGSKPISKENMVNLLEKYLGYPAGSLESLENANKRALWKIIRRFLELKGDSKDIFKDYLT